MSAAFKAQVERLMRSKGKHGGTNIAAAASMSAAGYDVTPQAIGGMRKRGRASLVNLEGLADYLGVSPAVLLMDTDPVTLARDALVLERHRHILDGLTQLNEETVTLVELFVQAAIDAQSNTASDL